MPWKNQSFIEWAYQILANYWWLIASFIVTVLLAIFRTAKKYGKVDWLESFICGLLTITIASLLSWLNLPNEVGIFFGGVIGFKGTKWVDQKFSEKYDQTFGSSTHDKEEL
ncbi:phage holin family protein [Acinetobacter dispersus]|uniref:phage holin family protein n=1 Tax=Acinetobacter dispersus TaxID=70348 RepID=UPI00132F371F|nr:phage holin family protein [Acinetobacter dispersus]QHH99245.1 phage holin, lambda family [Acinetobacter dispersus]